MAGYDCIAALGLSVERLLAASFKGTGDPIPNSAKKAKVALVRTEDFDVSSTSTAIAPPTLSIYVYRVDFNKTTRAGWSAVGALDGRGHLPLDVHFLITAWADNAEYEMRILGRAMQVLESTPTLAGPLLVAGAGWAPNETVQVVMEEISTEAVMRTYDSLPHDYKLSIPYVARVVRLDTGPVHVPEVASRITGVTAAVGS